jgi:hypothetical protein
MLQATRNSFAVQQRWTLRMYIDARVLTATLLLFLRSAATAQQACPTGWIPSPANAAWGPRCYFVPPERSTSLFRCVDLCAKEHEGTPACIGSAEENDFVAAKLVAADGLWLGLYQNETELGPAEGWDRCVGGDAPSFTNWHEPSEGRPNDYHGYQEDCALFDVNGLFGGKTGEWYDLACDTSIYAFQQVSLSCLCARGSASAAFAGADREALKATRAYNERLLTRRTTNAIRTAIAVAVLPFLLLLGRAGWRRLRRGAKAASSVGGQGAATSPSQSATVLSLSTPSPGAASSAAGRVKGKLHAARESAAARRLRVSFAMAQAGWAVSVFSLIPALMSLMSMSIDAAVGDFTWWLLPFPPGVCLLLLALFPTDAREIRVVCATTFVVFAGIGALQLSKTLIGDIPEQFGFASVGLLFAVPAVLAPTLRCRGDRAMQPRPALRRLWTVTRLFFLGFGVLNAGSNIADYLQGSKYGRHWARDVLSAPFLLCAALATPRIRGRIHRRLGRLGGRGTEAEEAAALAALVGGSAPDATLERASRLLRCLPVSRLLVVDFDDNLTTAPPAGPTLHARTEPAAMGEVTAFLSHSWSDEKEAPGAKHAVVTRWAALRQETTGKEPTLWLVRARPPSPVPPRACIHAR